MPHTIPPLSKNFHGQLQGEISLPGLPQALELLVESNQDRPLPFQEQAIQTLLVEWSALFPVVERALFAYYVDAEQGATESGPAIGTQSRVWHHVSLGRARIFNHQEAGFGVVQLTGSCSWEEEHGLEVDVLGSHLVYLGQHNGIGYRASSREKPWNFASAQTQRQVLGE